MKTIDTAPYQKLFFETTEDHLAAIEEQLKIFEKGTDAGINEIFRRTHSLKGSSSIMGYPEISRVCSRINDLIDPKHTKFTTLQLKSLKNLLKNLREEVAAARSVAVANKTL